MDEYYMIVIFPKNWKLGEEFGVRIFSSITEAEKCQQFFNNLGYKTVLKIDIVTDEFKPL